MGGGGVRVGGVRVDVNGEVQFLWKLKKNGGGGSGLECQGGGERRIEDLVDIFFFFWGGVRSGGRVRGGVRVDVNDLLKFLKKIKKKNSGRGQGGGGGLGVGAGWLGVQDGCERNVGGRGWCGVREMWTKNRKYCTMYKKVLYNIKKIKKNVCGGRGNIWTQNTLYVFKKRTKKKVKKKNDRAGIRTHDLRVKKNLLSYPLG